MGKRKKKQRKKKQGGGGFGKSGGHQGLVSRKRRPNLQPPSFMFDEFSPEERILEANKALSKDPGDISARLELADLELDHEKKLPLLEEIVADGRREYSELFENAKPEGKGLWAEYEARPLMEAMCELAKVYRRSAFKESTELFIELSKLNPIDNLGIRHELLNNYLTKNHHDEAEAIFEKYSDEVSADFLFGKAMVEFQKALDIAVEEGWKFDPDQKRPFSDKVFCKANNALNTAVEVYPWAIQLLLDCRTFMINSPPAWKVGSPAETLAFSKRAGFLWTNLLCALWLISEGLLLPRAEVVGKSLKEHSEEYLSILSGLDLFDRNDFLLDDVSDFAGEAKEIMELCMIAEEVLVTASLNG